MTGNDKPLDQAAEDELKGVPEELREGGEGDMTEALEALRQDLENARRSIVDKLRISARRNRARRQG